jgi:DNA polymerase III alpha subunit
MKKTGVEIEVRPPDINFSSTGFTCDASEQRIFFSLQKIKGVGAVAVENIMKTRNEGGQFFSLDEFLSRVPSKVNKTVVTRLIIAGAFDLIEDIKNPAGRKELLRRYLAIKGAKLPEEYTAGETATDAFWIIEQKRLTGFGEVDYKTMIQAVIPNSRLSRLYVDDNEYVATPLGHEVTVAGRLIYYKERQIKTGVMGMLKIDCNNTIIDVILWPETYEKIQDRIENIKGSIVALNGRIEKDKWRNERKIISNSGTKFLVIKEEQINKQIKV